MSESFSENVVELGMDLKRALAIATKVASNMQPACSRVEIAGSIRREKPEVKDIEIVAIVDDYTMLYQRLASFGKFIKPGVPEIIEWPPKANAKYIRMLLSESIKLDLFVANVDNWGGIFMLRTGCGVDDKGNVYNGFSPGMLQRWKRVSGGGKMSGGQLVMPDGTILPQNEEEQIFDLVMLQWIPPNQRTSKKVFKLYEKHTSI